MEPEELWIITFGYLDFLVQLVNDFNYYVLSMIFFQVQVVR